MSPLTKAFVVLATLLSVVMVSLTVAHVARTEDYRAKFVDVQNDRNDALKRQANENAALATQLALATNRSATEESDLADVRGDLTEQLGVIRTLNEQIATLETRNARLTAANAAQAATLQAQTERLDSQTGQITGMIGDMATLAREKSELAQAIEVAVADRDRYFNEVRRLTEQLIAAEANEAALGQEVERLRIAMAENDVDPDVQIASGPRIQGSVTRVDQVGEGLTLVQVNVGSRDGVREDMSFTIFRGDRYIGTMEINTVDTDMAVGELKLHTGQVEDGDDVKTGR